MVVESEIITRAYSQLIRVLTEYVVVITRDFRIISANELFERDFGRSEKTFGDFCHWTNEDAPDPFVLMRGDEHVGDYCYRVWKNRQNKCEDCHVEKCFSKGEAFTSEEMVETAQGRTLRIRVRATPVKNEEGKVIFVIQSATDIAHREYLESHMDGDTRVLEALLAEQYLTTRENERKFRLLFERSQDMIALTDREGNLRDVNPAGVRLLGYDSKGEVRKIRALSKLFSDPADWNVIVGLVEEEGVVHDFETALKKKNGDEVPVGVTANVFFDREGRILGYEGIIRDISARKRAEQIIRQTNRELAAINAINKASSVLGLEDMLKTTVEEISSLLHVDSARIYLLDESGDLIYLVVSKGLTEAFVEKTHMQLRSVGDGLIGKVVSTGKEMVFSDLAWVPSPFKEDLWQEGLKSAAYIPILSKGSVLGVIAVTSHSGHQFTKREVAFLSAVGNEVGISVMNRLLYEQTRTAYEELKKAQEQLIQTEKLASLGKMSAVFAHEINNPISAILTYAKLVTKVLKKQDLNLQERIPDLLRYLETVQNETSRCGEIVKNLLTFARQSEPKFEGNSLTEILQRTISLVSHDLELKSVQLVVDVQENIPLIKCDFKQIQQVFLNLLINASEAMEQGGRITVRGRHIPFRKMVRIEIIDTGHGISEEDKGQIFEPFYTTKGETKGVGLGLAVVYGIITRHGGTIEVTSEKGKGSTFIIDLPIETQDEQKS